jgi:LuxR family quorum sensing-dependent transcriptional regulator
MYRLQTALDLIGDLSSQTGVDPLLADFGRIIGNFGFDAFLLARLPDPGGRIDDNVLLSGWSAPWFERYASQNYVRVDPIARRLRSAEAPFVWSEHLAERSLDPDERQVMEEAAAIGMRDGFCVPLWGLDGRRAGLSLAAHRVDLSPAERALMQLVAVHAQARIEALASPSPAEPGPRLSPRERECLRWIAAGKTSWEVSSILGLSESTTDGYIAAAARKLGAANRTQAVAEAIRRGIIV